MSADRSSKVSGRRAKLREVLFAASGSLVFAAPACAQSAPPPPRENANIWNGEAHEPNPGNVAAEERRAGIAPDRQQQQSLTNEVEHLDRKLERRAR